MTNRLNVERLMKTLSEILSEKYGCEITMTAIPRDQASPELLAKDAAQKEAAAREKEAAEKEAAERKKEATRKRAAARKKAAERKVAECRA